MRLRTAYILTFIAVGSAVALLAGMFAFGQIWMLGFGGKLPKFFNEQDPVISILVALAAWAATVVIGFWLGTASESRSTAASSGWRTGERLGLLVVTLVSVLCTGTVTARVLDTIQTADDHAAAYAASNRAFVRDRFVIDSLSYRRAGSGYLLTVSMNGTLAGEYTLTTEVGVASGEVEGSLVQLTRHVHLEKGTAREIVPIPWDELERTYCELAAKTGGVTRDSVALRIGATIAYDSLGSEQRLVIGDEAISRSEISLNETFRCERRSTP